MIQQIRKSIQKQKLFGAGDQILLAISGGIDSIVMLDIMSKLSASLGIAHVNHSLRAAESDQDELFVRQLAADYQLPYHSIKVDVKAVAKASKANLSDAGHQVRYDFFAKIADEHGYSKIATAHHADDIVESFLMRAMEGAGLRGISGIPRQNGRVIRPLLDISKDQIVSYAVEHKLRYREDSSNASLYYRRNAIRAIIRPALSEINQTADKGIRQSAAIAADAHQALRYLSEQFAIRHFQKTEASVKMPISSFQWDGGQSVLYYCLSDYGFNRTQVIQIQESHLPGALFYSKTHSLLVDREDYLIEPFSGSPQTEHLYIHGLGNFQVPGIGQLSITEVAIASLDNDPNVEYLPSEAIRFPILIRPWQAGDRFRPIGMKGQSKSIQDYLVDQKIPRTAKSQIRLLMSQENEVIWIMGHRLSHDYRITDQHTVYIQLVFVPTHS